MRAARTLLQGGLLCGTLDGIAALVNYLANGGQEPLRVFTFIASGAFGRDALTGGWPMAAAGIAFHYLIATIWTAIFFVAATRAPRLLTRPFITGALYGIVVWALMSRVVVPLSRTPPLRFDAVRALVGIGIHIVCVGIPIVWTVARGARRPRTWR